MIVSMGGVGSAVAVRLVDTGELLGRVDGSQLYPLPAGMGEVAPLAYRCSVKRVDYLQVQIHTVFRRFI